MPTLSGETTYDVSATIAFSIVLLTAMAAPLLQTPYGRFADARWGASLDPRLGWFLMELPAPVVFLATFVGGPHRAEPYPLVLLAVWSFHYLNRGFLMPLLMRVPRGQKGSFSLMVVAIGWLVTSLHGYLNARWATTFHANPSATWLADPRFLLGFAIYALAMGGNLHADHVLRTLRTRDEVARGERVHRIPRGGLFELVTNASYFTELVAWSGFALMTWSPGGLFILGISLANLVPRALATHRWYLAKFPAYPRERKILVPYVW